MLKKILLIMAALLFVAAPSASAQGYGDDDTITISDNVVAPGDSVTLNAFTYCSGCPVTFTLTSDPVVLGTANANGSGVATLIATIPLNTTPGPHTITATGTGVDGQPLTLRTAITVTGGTGGTGGARGDLPTTGTSSSVPMTQIAIGAIAAGGLMVLVAKRRANANERDTETASV